MAAPSRYSLHLSSRSGHKLHLLLTTCLLPLLLTGRSTLAQQQHGPALQLLSMYVPVNMGGVKGHVRFEQKDPRNTRNITVTVHLMTAGEEARHARYSWFLHEFPVFLDQKQPCATSELGRTRHDLGRRHGILDVGPPNNMSEVVFYDQDIELEGPNSIWGRALLLRATDSSQRDLRACGNVQDDSGIRTAEAVFHTPVAGQVVFRQSEQTSGITTIFTNLFHTGDDYMPAGRYDWRILISDILDTDASKRSEKRCDFLQIVFDPENRAQQFGEEACTTKEHSKCRMGDMVRKHGEITVAPTNSRYSKKLYIDTSLALSHLDGYRSMYLAVYEKANPFRIMACSKISLVSPRKVLTYFDSDGVRGTVQMEQRYKMDPTIVKIQLQGLRGRGGAYHVHEFPVAASRLGSGSERCSIAAVGDNFNPYNVDRNKSPLPGFGTNDEYQVGDLSGKHGFLVQGSRGDSHEAMYVDFNLPLFGTNSVVGRSLVIHQVDGTRWICSSITYPSETVTAVATFFYPIVGRVIFRQEINNPWAETTVLAELTYADGTANSTEGHRFDIHLDPPGRDFYNWTKRCESAGKDYNPFDVGVRKQREKVCHPGNALRCAVGDLTSKAGIRISVAAKRGAILNKFYYTDVNLPLSGPHSVLHRSLVVHDDHAPPHRGDRLACTTIMPTHPLIAAVRRWSYGAGIPSNVSGTIVFKQESEFDLAEVHVDLTGLERYASGYHIHQLPVPMEKSFPCNDDSVRGHFNPYGLDTGFVPAPAVGSVDQYEVGDLSGKYGTLDDKDIEQSSLLDSNLQLYGRNSVIGRSVVIHLRERNQRWACGTILPEIRREDGRELIAVASFDDPKSAVQGFVRLRQLEYKDGSSSETFIEVDLRYPGKYDRNLTRGHEWAVYVNQVGHDAVEPNENVRCIAAGYRWNPYLAIASSDGYKADCNPSNPLRCEMGDLTGKHGHLEVGQGRRAVFIDPNLPLVGNYSVLGRSIVIFGKEGAGQKLGCANLKPDIHLIRHVSVRKFPGFTSGQFMSHMRELLSATDWVIQSDRQSERDILGGQCTQMTVHFFGSEAHRWHIEFGNLIGLGSVRKQTPTGLKLIRTFYKPCKTLEEELNEINSAQRPVVDQAKACSLAFAFISTIFTLLYTR
ncbi:uncharacterized protein LOC111254308 [Varroa destructor]|uniref:Superoxide dismutase copper/zinc binding domain-containing protein n=1 Tax=Varroa destructor TaxID=109461 RepID=A0A7M7KU51_VARDE|nr:uncharacterized protein LOC111254308 [Varroa destructor]